MDAPIINIIVTIAVVLYVLRRMREVSQKGRDITAPPIPQSMFGEREADEDEEDTFPELRRVDQGESSDDEMRHRETGRRSVHEELRPDTVLRRFEVPEEPPPPRARKSPAIPMPGARRYRATDEDTIEVWPETAISDRGQDEESRAFDRAVPRASISAGGPESAETRGRHRKQPRGIVPHFGRRELIRGIIMREVLGPPVGMRSGTE